MQDHRVGAYGFHLMGLDDASEWLVRAPGEWPTVEVECAVDQITPERILTDEFAQIPLIGGGYLHIVKESLSLRFVSPNGVFSPAEVVHPLLAPAASILAFWHGMTALHAGAVVVNGRAWIITGDREAGKSSTLAELSLRGYKVLADDLVVLSGDHVLAGPRSLDLRGPDRAGLAEDLGIVGQRLRWRMKLPTVPAAVPLGGVVALQWATTSRVVELGLDDKVGVLAPAASMPLSKTQTLRALAMPTFLVARPATGVAHTVDLLLEFLESAT